MQRLSTDGTLPDWPMAALPVKTLQAFAKVPKLISILHTYATHPVIRFVPFSVSYKEVR
jgi:hypothetical protein